MWSHYFGTFLRRLDEHPLFIFKTSVLPLSSLSFCGALFYVSMPMSCVSLSLLI